MVYHEKFKVISFEGVDMIVHVVDHLNDEELIEFFNTAIETDNFEYAASLAAEATLRGLEKRLKI